MARRQGTLAKYFQIENIKILTVEEGKHKIVFNSFKFNLMNYVTLTLSNDSIGLDPFKQFPVNFSSSIVCTKL